jgi:glyoxylase-like metal-dependent hydrolase (beta-lactamase superfamily II)
MKLVIEQLLSGRDHARGHAHASQMANFAYLVGDADAGEAVLVDPSWDVGGLLAAAKRKGLKVVGGVATHGHADHVGGRIFGVAIEGMRELAATGVPVWCHELEREQLLQAGVPAASLRTVKEGDEIPVGGARLSVMHTPGHTPGGICLSVGDALFTGDTLFVRECGRVDLPGSDPAAMFRSMRRLGALPPATRVFPGHDYGPTPTSTIESEVRNNPCLLPTTEEEWQDSLAPVED